MGVHTTIAIDGPAAAGKSTIAKIIAEKLSFLYIDTGAMYRAVTLKALKEAIDLKNERALYQLLLHTSIDLRQDGIYQKVLLDGEDVTEEIRSQVVTKNVSQVAIHPLVREELVKRQRKFADEQNVVMDGRDIGTHVLPNADVKIFLIASVDERAKRRHKENQQRGIPSNLEDLKKEIEERDLMDTERETSPLVKASDAIEIDTTSLSINEVVDKIRQIVDKKIQK